VAVQDINDFTSLGGVRPKETATAINRATTANDQARILNAFDYHNSPTWVPDKSGNGGGGKAGL
jgi:hypothetical protein